MVSAHIPKNSHKTGPLGTLLNQHGIAQLLLSHLGPADIRSFLCATWELDVNIFTGNVRWEWWREHFENLRWAANPRICGHNVVKVVFAYLTPVPAADTDAPDVPAELGVTHCLLILIVSNLTNHGFRTASVAQVSSSLPFIHHVFSALTGHSIPPIQASLMDGNKPSYDYLFKTNHDVAVATAISQPVTRLNGCADTRRRQQQRQRPQNISHNIDLRIMETRRRALTITLNTWLPRYHDVGGVANQAETAAMWVVDLTNAPGEHMRWPTRWDGTMLEEMKAIDSKMLMH